MNSISMLNANDQFQDGYESVLEQLNALGGVLQDYSPPSCDYLSELITPVKDWRASQDCHCGSVSTKISGCSRNATNVASPGMQYRRSFAKSCESDQTVISQSQLDKVTFAGRHLFFKRYDGQDHRWGKI